MASRLSQSLQDCAALEKTVLLWRKESCLNNFQVHRLLLVALRGSGDQRAGYDVHCGGDALWDQQQRADLQCVAYCRKYVWGESSSGCVQRALEVMCKMKRNIPLILLMSLGMCKSVVVRAQALQAKTYAYVNAAGCSTASRMGPASDTSPTNLQASAKAVGEAPAASTPPVTNLQDNTRTRVRDTCELEHTLFLVGSADSPGMQKAKHGRPQTFALSSPTFTLRELPSITYFPRTSLCNSTLLCERASYSDPRTSRLKTHDNLLCSVRQCRKQTLQLLSWWKELLTLPTWIHRCIDVRVLKTEARHSYQHPYWQWV